MIRRSDVEIHDQGFAEVWISPPRQRDDSDRPTVLMGKIAAALTQYGELSQRKILAAVPGKREYNIKALDLLILDGYVSDKTPHTLLKPYNEHLTGGS